MSDLHVYYTPSIFKTGIIVNEKLTWNQTRSGVKSPETYNFGLDRSLNLDYKLTNTLSSKYSWSGQSKLNEYRGYLWTAVKELDPGTVTQKTESFNILSDPNFPVYPSSQRRLYQLIVYIAFSVALPILFIISKIFYTNLLSTFRKYYNQI